MRTLEEIKVDVKHAMSINDASALQSLAAELNEHGTPEALAMEANARGTSKMFVGSYSEALEQYEHALSLHEDLDDHSDVPASGAVNRCCLRTLVTFSSVLWLRRTK